MAAGSSAAVRSATSAGHRAQASEAHDCAFRHEVLFHGDGADGFVREVGPLVADAVADDAHVLVAVRADRIELLREALVDGAGRVMFADMRELGTNPARIIPAWRTFLDRNADAETPLLGVGEPIWPGRSDAELAECERHESLLNLAFGGERAWRLVCPYDLDGLQDEVIAAARHNHPYLAASAGSVGNSDYWRDHRPVDPFRGELPPPPSAARRVDFGEGDLARIRHLLTAWAEEHLPDPESTEELVLAVDEIASNSVSYGGGRGTLRVWREPEAVLCEIRDGGRIEAPLAGRIEPHPDAGSGRGLWIANSLCDLVQIRSSAQGSVVRVHKRLA